MNINCKFNCIFRRVPEIYNKRKAYHKAFRFMLKNERCSLKDIDLLLWNIRDFNGDETQLKAIFKKVNSASKCSTSDYKSIRIFTQSILSDMHSVLDVPIKKENLNYVSDIFASFVDVVSLYPSLIINSEVYCDDIHFNSQKENRISILF